MNPTLYITPTPIGNYEDITLRALKILKAVDFIICEETKPANRLLAYFDIKKELISLNEHNESEISQEIANILLEGKSAALISDAGTPLFSDPGHILVDLCISYKINIVPLPGANSLLPTLISSGLNIEKFYHFGWLSPKKEIRRQELRKLKNIRDLIVIMETPYRLKRLLEDIIKNFTPSQHIVLAYKLTMPEEKIFRDTVSNILKIVEQKNLKGEFVLLLDNR
ncbi:MAG: 16S rRNA (cytidine(1402)-2'-O)-methyltransferase [Ignavibacteriales bacterium]|nr:16S rRNA (cytidine(1402)-2'-O)-methyltransferase [Ignavibacteriales bacterium]